MAGANRTQAARLPSIRHRLASALVVVSAAWGLAVAGAVAVVVHQQVDELLDNGLQESAEILYGLLRFNAQALPLRDGQGALPAPAHDERMVWQLVGANGRVQLRSHRAPEQALAPETLSGHLSSGDTWHVYGMPFDDSGRRLFVAQRHTDRQRAQLQAGALTTVAALAVGLLAAAWMRRRVRAELVPLDRLSQAVSAYDPLHGQAPLAAPLRDELVVVHHAIEALGTRLAQRVAREQAFAAHAAHALRTPLAGVVAQLAVLQREVPQSLQTRVQRTRAASDRLRRVVTALLTMFRSGGELQATVVDLEELLTHLPVEGLTVNASVHHPIRADADLLAAALLNLLDNALRHGATTVTLFTEAPGVLLLHDNGRGLEEARRIAMQQQLDRQDYERPVGLGLMLADLVARAHGGRLILVPGQAPDGCTVRLDLKAASAGLSDGGSTGLRPQPDHLA